MTGGLPGAAHAQAAPDWERWLPLPGVVDVAGPRADGSLVAVAAAGLVAISQDGATAPLVPWPGASDVTTAIALSPGLDVAAGGCQFGPGEVFVVDRSATPPGVWRVVEGAEPSPFVEVPQVERLSGITFDGTGRFGSQLLVVGARAGRGVVLSVDCRGRLRAVSEDTPLLDGVVAVAPAGFGSHGGDLIGVDEHSGDVIFVRPDGTSGVLVSSELPIGTDAGARSLGFIPEGFSRRGGTAYLAERPWPGSASLGAGGIRRLTAEALARIGIDDNDLLVAAAGGGRTILIRCRAGCRTLPLGQAPDAQVQGRIAVVLGPPPPPLKTRSNPGGTVVFGIVTGVLILGGFVLFFRHRERPVAAPASPSEPGPSAVDGPGRGTQR